MKKSGMRQKLILTFIILFTIPMLLASFLFSRYAKSFAKDKTLSLNNQEMANVGASLDLIFDYVYNYSLYPPFDAAISSYLESDATADNYRTLERTATNSLILLPYTNSSIRGITIWRNDGDYIRSGSPQTMSESEKDFLVERNGNPFWSFEKSSGSSKFFFSRLLKNPLFLSRSLGYIKIQIDTNSIQAALSGPSDNHPAYFIMDETGSIFYASKPQSLLEKYYPSIQEEDLPAIAQKLLKQEPLHSVYDKKANCYFTTCSISNTDWTLLCISDNSLSLNLVRYLRNIYLGYIIICIPACILLALIFSAYITSPLKKMGELMQQIEKENFSVHLDINSNDELAVLAQQFNHMSDELSDLYNRVYLGNIRLKEAQFSALSAQINPHFLYNTLDTIYWMSEFNHTADVSRMVSALSQLFRLSLSGNQDDMIPLRSELEHVRCFLYIEKIRYDDQLNYTIDILDRRLEDHSEQYMVLKLILQPITENAIIHGIDAQGQGDIAIRISIEQDTILYEVSNSGTADVNHIQRILNNPQYVSDSIGLSNIQQRIHLKYGEKYGIICFNQDRRTIFQIRLPIHSF